MKCFYYFKCSFGKDLENPIFNKYCGPVIKETKDGFFIENHANNDKMRSKWASFFCGFFTEERA